MFATFGVLLLFALWAGTRRLYGLSTSPYDACTCFWDWSASAGAAGSLALSGVLLWLETPEVVTLIFIWIYMRKVYLPINSCLRPARSLRFLTLQFFVAVVAIAVWRSDAPVP